MNRYTELVHGLEEALDLAYSLGSRCSCQEGFTCRVCKLRLLLSNAKEDMKKGTLESVRPRKKIRCITTDRVFNTIKEASDCYGVQSATISKCLKGKLKVAGMFAGMKLEWRYEE